MAEQNLNSDGIWDGTPGSLEAGAGADEDGGWMELQVTRV